MKLLLISPSRTTEKEIQQVISFFEHGLRVYHLRKPNMSTREMKEYLKKIPAAFHNRIIIHSHHKLASQFNLKGIHLTRIHLKRRFRTWWRLRTLLLKKPGLVVTTSFHKIGSVYSNDQNYHYAFLGTIFDKVSGKYNVGYSEHSLRAGIERSTNPLIARGGTALENVALCRDLGFSGMVFYSGIWKAEDPLQKLCAIKDKFRELNIEED
ncbi:MAG: thiamine phosphate synthase [Bacteroidetes bacterium]|nr:thiamine phosphate synthase [Bacteroidota bacterium]